LAHGLRLSFWNWCVPPATQNTTRVFSPAVEPRGIQTSHSNKSKIIGEVKVPKKYLFDFLRGHLDGDGYTFSYWDPRWKSSFMFYLGFCSASQKHILWLQNVIKKELSITGHITKAKKSSCYQLKYAQKESFKLLKRIYHKNANIFLKRKRLKIDKMLAIIGEKL